MAKLLVEDKEESTSVPFMRGILTRSLQQSGLPFQRAYELSGAVREELEDERVISTLELHRLVYKKLRKEYGENVADRYLRPHEQRPPVQVRDIDGHLSPFSSELHRRDLENIGLSLPESMKVAKKLRQHLFRKKIREVSTRYIARETYKLLQNTPALGPPVANRWLVWRHFVHSGRPLIILLGGTTGCGKSTIATALAHRLDIVRMQSTDLLREVMRNMFSTQQHPALHRSSYQAWRTLNQGDDDLPLPDDGDVEKGYLAQVELVDTASRAVIERALKERVSLIIEGVHAHPRLAEGIEPRDAVIFHFMLAVLKKKQLRKRIKGRSTMAVQRRAREYLEHFDEIWQLQSYLLSEAEDSDIPIIVNTEREEVVRQIMRHILSALSETQPPSPDEVFAE